MFREHPLITIPPLIVYLFFNRQIVAGMTACAVKGWEVTDPCPLWTDPGHHVAQAEQLLEETANLISTADIRRKAAIPEPSPSGLAWVKTALSHAAAAGAGISVEDRI